VRDHVLAVFVPLAVAPSAAELLVGIRNSRRNGRRPVHRLATAAQARGITGGTGNYSGANGTIELVESGHDVSSKNTLTFRLIP